MACQRRRPQNDDEKHCCLTALNLRDESDQGYNDHGNFRT